MPPRKAPTGLLVVRGVALDRGVEAAVVAESSILVEGWKDRLVVVGVLLRRREVVGDWRRARMLLGVRSLVSIVVASLV